MKTMLMARIELGSRVNDQRAMPPLKVSCTLSNVVDALVCVLAYNRIFSARKPKVLVINVDEEGESTRRLFYCLCCIRRK